MATVVPVTKMHGTRNDFILVDERTESIPDYPQFAKTFCDRRAGVGADGLLVILSSAVADVRMRVFNADGSEAEMCGNGVRCFAAYLNEKDGSDSLRIETKGGIIGATVLAGAPDYSVRVQMGVPKFGKSERQQDNVAVVSLGNPHTVLFAKGLDDVDLDEAGPRYNQQTSGGTNVHVVVKAGPSRLLVRHWERGVGKTMACGTGAVAAATAAIQRGDVASPVEVNVPGGRLIVEWDASGEASLTGPAVRVFDAVLPL